MAGVLLRMSASTLRLAGKNTLAMLGRVLPPSCFRPLRHCAEQVAFRMRPDYQGDTLPAMFHYWSVECLSPRLRSLGLSAPETFFLDEILAAARDLRRPVRVASFGAGACALEIDLARRLQSQGIESAFTCVDFNGGLLRTAKTAASAQGVSTAMEFLRLDCNRLPELAPYDVILVNQFFHHVEALETFCASLSACLAEGGRLLTSDVIGRNGHLLWPDVEDAVAMLWTVLPEQRRYDRYFGRILDTYRPVDHASYSNEGIRAQDVVECLLAEFDFEVFFPWGGSIMPFIERRVGFNFDVNDATDRAFIRSVDGADMEALDQQRYPASNMIASLRHKECATRRVIGSMGAEQHARLTRAQLRRLRVA